MDLFYKIIALLGGLSMFLYGMRIMGDGLKQSSGGAMKLALARVTNKPAIGFIFGMLVTCMIQSSTATIVLTVGLVGAGFLSFRQSVGIVLGANVGTAITAQIIRLMDVSAGTTSILYFFKADNLAPVALIAGIILIMFIKGKNSQNLGTILIGFGILFMGLIFMSDAVSEMSDSLSGLLTAFEDNYILGFLSGVLVTGIIQSSSAVVGMLQSMASSMGLRFCAVFAVIIGVNIGDCLTTFLVSRIGAKPEQIRTATVHVIYNVIAATLIAVTITVLRVTGVLGNDLWYRVLNSGGVANLHGVFRLVPAVLLLPFSGALARMSERIVPDKPEARDNEEAEIEDNLRDLDPLLFNSPELALDRAGHVIRHMADTALQNLNAACSQIVAYNDKRAEKINKRELLLDRMADATNRYLVDLSGNLILDQHHLVQAYQIKALTSFERIGDRAKNIADDVSALREHEGTFSEDALNDLTIAVEAVADIFNVTLDAYKNNNLNDARRVEPMEEVIDSLMETMKDRHIYRMTHNICSINSGIQFENIITNLERISDQCSDLAVFIISQINTEIIGREHDYIHNLHHSGNKEYLDAYNENYKKYYGQLTPQPGRKSDTQYSFPPLQ